jgi:hypothetical protein
VLCQLCHCEESHNFHHFIPRTLHSNKWFKKRYTREQMHEGIEVCKPCDQAIHDLVPDEKKLGRHYNTLEKLLANPEVGKCVQWKRRRARTDEKG